MSFLNIGMVLMLIFIGLSAGFLGGSMGVGGGVIMVPALALIGFSQYQAQGTSLAVMLPPVTVLAVLNYSKQGYINWKYAAIMSLMFMIGGYLGSKLAISISEKSLKQFFGVLMFVVSIKILLGK